MLDLHSKDPMRLYEENKDIVEMNRNRYEKPKVLVEALDRAEKEEYENFESVEEEQLYVEEETTSLKDIYDFEKHMKKDAKKNVVQLFV